ncbi:MAG: ABC transporter ATP-binding protein [Planctomycetes bacterium]|nr:ABC transporter ATP-binding protein [Planctomycetota bacterium]
MSSADASYDDEHAPPRDLDFALWRRIGQHARPYKRPLLGLVAAGLVVAAADAIIPLVTGRLIDAAIAHEGGAVAAAYATGYVLALFAIAISVYFFIRFAGQAATGVAYDLRRQGFKRLQELPFSYFDTRPTGWLVTRLTSDCEKLSSLLPWFLLDLVWGAAVILGITIAMFVLDWRLALVVLAIVPPLAILSAVFQKRLLHSSRMIRKTYAILTANFSESLMGVRTTKSLNREEGNLGEFQGRSTEMYRYSMTNALQSAVYLPIVASLGALGVGLALWRGGIGVSLGEVSLGTLIAFMQYAALFTMPIQEMAERFTQLQAAQAAAERVQGLLDTTPEIRDSVEVQAALAEWADRERPEGIAIDGGIDRIDRIEFKDVEFSYKKGEPVLRGFDLEVEAGETVALVGATGGGKSTIVSLLSRFYEPTSGEVRLNGVDYRQRSLHWLQSNLGVVLQVPFLFSGTIREAIRYGRLDASDEEVEAAARLVGAAEFIAALPEGYEAPVGEGGSRLSTGQRQLIALARAVLADPQVFVMDEATSSVDTETEALIQAAVEKVLKGRIAFVIAHRLSTIRNADKIMVIDGGRVVEAGRHQELLAERGRYHALYTGCLARDEATRLARAG